MSLTRLIAHDALPSRRRVPANGVAKAKVKTVLQVLDPLAAVGSLHAALIREAIADELAHLVLHVCQVEEHGAYHAFVFEVPHHAFLPHAPRCHRGGRGGGF